MKRAPGSCSAGLTADNTGRSLTGAAAEPLAHHLGPGSPGRPALWSRGLVAAPCCGVWTPGIGTGHGACAGIA